MNYTTRKYPRTLTEAFGPYAGGSIDAPERNAPMTWQDKLVLWAAIVTGVAALVLVIGPDAAIYMLMRGMGV